MAAARGKGRPTTSEAAAIDRNMREAALQVLLDQGDGATMNAVALAAGISRKSLYARYANKTELFTDVIRQLLGDVRGLTYDRRGTGAEQLRNYVAAALNVIARPQSQALQRLLTMNPDYLGALRPDMLAASRKLFFEPLRDLLAEGAAQEEFALTDVDATAQMLMGLIFAESMGLASDAPRTAPDIYAGFVTELLLRGLSPRKKWPDQSIDGPPD